MATTAHLKKIRHDLQIHVFDLAGLPDKACDSVRILLLARDKRPIAFSPDEMDEFAALAPYRDTLTAALTSQTSTWRARARDDESPASAKILLDIEQLEWEWERICKIALAPDAVAAYEVTRIERAIAKKRERHLMAVASLCHDLMVTATASERALPIINEADYLLCHAWHSIAPQLHAGMCDWTSKFVELVGLAEANRLMAARMAELAVQDYFIDLGCTVRDVAIDQITTDDGEWRNVDLEANGQRYDVKNARQSFTNPETYVEHFVPAHKLRRVGRSNVRLFATIAPYAIFPLNDYWSDRQRQGIQLLGAATEGSIQSVVAWISRRFSGTLALSGMWKADFQPGWMFEFTEVHYPRRAVAIERTSQVIGECLADGMAAEDLPAWLLMLCNDGGILEASNLSTLQRRIWEDIQDMRANGGISRPMLFTYVMGFFLENLLLRRPLDSFAPTLKACLFYRREQHGSPLGLDDPLQYVRNVFKLLQQVYTYILAQEAAFVSFRMTHPAILTGKDGAGRSIKLIAYCGGWRRHPRVKCGATPLFFGRNLTCHECGNLACHVCGYCNQRCGYNDERQQLVATEDEQSLSPDTFD